MNRYLLADALRRAVGTRIRRVLVAVMVLLGVLAAVGTSAGSADDRTLAGLAAPVQSAMSVIVAFLGVLLASDLARVPSLPLAPTLVAAALVGAATAAVGAVLCALTVAVAPAVDQPWAHTPLVLLGSLLVQVNATLVCVGLGQLIRPPVVGEIATIVLPLGMFGFFGAVPGLHGAQQWLTPFATVQHLLSGQMTGSAWAQWAVVVLVWVVGLNVAGAARLRRAAPALRIR